MEQRAKSKPYSRKLRLHKFAINTTESTRKSTIGSTSPSTTSEGLAKIYTQPSHKKSSNKFTLQGLSPKNNPPNSTATNATSSWPTGSFKASARSATPKPEETNVNPARPSLMTSKTNSIIYSAASANINLPQGPLPTFTLNWENKWTLSKNGSANKGRIGQTMQKESPKGGSIKKSGIGASLAIWSGESKFPSKASKRKYSMSGSKLPLGISQSQQIGWAKVTSVGGKKEGLK